MGRFEFRRARWAAAAPYSRVVVLMRAARYLRCHGLQLSLRHWPNSWISLRISPSASPVTTSILCVDQIPDSGNGCVVVGQGNPLRPFGIANLPPVTLSAGAVS